MTFFMSYILSYILETGEIFDLGTFDRFAEGEFCEIITLTLYEHLSLNHFQETPLPLAKWNIQSHMFFIVYCGALTENGADVSVNNVIFTGSRGYNIFMSFCLVSVTQPMYFSLIIKHIIGPIILF